jgi:CRP/FNR family cyclic AMP-dependent transcriptional regulator
MAGGRKPRDASNQASAGRGSARSIPGARVPGRTVGLTPAGPVRLFEADPALARGLPAEVFARLTRHVLADTRSLARGHWAPRQENLGESLFGLLILEGALVRRVSVGRRHGAELLGEGDLIRPEQDDADEYAIVAQSADWSVLAPTRLAVLDHDLVTSLAGIGRVLPELAARLVQRVRALALQLAIAQIPNLADRLHLLLWHLADRWGRQESGAVTLRLRLSQDLLADLLSAQRTSVGSALHDLTVRGVIEERAGTWALCGDPPGDLLVRS